MVIEEERPTTLEASPIPTTPEIDSKSPFPGSESPEVKKLDSVSPYPESESPEIKIVLDSSSPYPVLDSPEIKVVPLSELSNLFTNGLSKRVSDSEEKEDDVSLNLSPSPQLNDEVLTNGGDIELKLNGDINDECNLANGDKSSEVIAGDDLNDAKAHLSDASRRIHDMDLEIKRLENEREELSAAYREAETLRKQEEAKAQRLSSELASVRHDYERRLTQKEEELEALRKQMAIEMDQLSQRLAEAEAKVKTEVARIKKKMQVQITELEMSLDVSNKQNIDMQKTIKIQSTKIMEIQSHYEECSRQLQQSLDQLGISQRRCQGLTAELEELRVSLESTLRAKRTLEQSLDESHSKISELTQHNVNLTSAKGKLENEYLTLHNDYEEISKELRVSDERYNRVIVELKSTKDLMVETEERYIKIEHIKKSLEVEVRNLQIRIEEVETNALAGGRRVVSKLEARIRDIELELEEEKKRHAETQKIQRKKEHRVKELLLQTEEDHKTISMLNDAVEKLTEKVKVYKRQLSEQEGMSQQNLTRVRRFQRELEAAEDRAEQAESNLSFVRSRHRTIVTGPASLKQVFVTTTEESSSSTQNY
ncbi:hypothetical protein JTE90_019668 [Oedothorax gibbosus]|uniref:Paramyosin n=1 Tax=Oedothorax gibbosus TaxID=931172 RepID=A0AAV6UYX4_9ARAC|nr:hypothetical protein JTE90_019668 [Oedothorax gibbosus]